jgi:N-acetylglucosaminyldiphosphoundecaprenol N-acetyl-beta-D-mannosaminyltransferase
VAIDTKRIMLGGIGFDCVVEADVVAHVLAELAAGRGGRIITPNVDILRRTAQDADARRHVASATVVVADGAPLIWASRLAGKPLPTRVAGSDLIWSLSEALGRKGRSVYLLGGEPGTARIAASVLGVRFPGLELSGFDSPPFGFDADPIALESVCRRVVAARPDLVFVGLGFPKQELVIERLQDLLPQTWFMGCGAAIGFVAGVRRRAPGWMQRTGLEWLHRLISEPRRLMRRYLLHDVPYATRLLTASAFGRSSPAEVPPAPDWPVAGGFRVPRQRSRRAAEAGLPSLPGPHGGPHRIEVGPESVR